MVTVPPSRLLTMTATTRANLACKLCGSSVKGKGISPRAQLRMTAACRLLHLLHPCVSVDVVLCLGRLVSPAHERRPCAAWCVAVWVRVVLVLGPHITHFTQFAYSLSKLPLPLRAPLHKEARVNMTRVLIERNCSDRDKFCTCVHTSMQQEKTTKHQRYGSRETRQILVTWWCHVKHVLSYQTTLGFAGDSPALMQWFTKSRRIFDDLHPSASSPILLQPQARRGTNCR